MKMAAVTEETISSFVSRLSNEPGLLFSAVEWYQLGLIQSERIRKKSNQLPLEQVWANQPMHYQRQLSLDIQTALWRVLEDDTMIDNREKALLSCFGLAESVKLPTLQTWEMPQVLRLLSCRTQGETFFDEFIQYVLFQPRRDFADVVSMLHACHENNVKLSTEDTSSTLTSAFLEHYMDEAERSYLESLIMNSQDDTEKLQLDLDDDSDDSRSKSKPHHQKRKAQDAVQLRIDQICQVLPDLGEGFVEAVLSNYSGDLERALHNLMDRSSLPQHLQLMDPKLPRRHLARNSKSDEDEQIAKERSKAFILASEQANEAQARAIDHVMTGINEYDDDFFEDDYEGVVGTNDHGLYDDYEAVKSYNRALQSIEGEAQFWDAERNTNRDYQQGGKKKKSFGPDKVRGGHIPNAGRGGRGRGNRGRDGKNTNDESKQLGNTDDTESSTNAESHQKKDNSKPSRSQQRRKQQKLNQRRDKQKQNAARNLG